MGFTTEAIDVSPVSKGPQGPVEFDLPVKEFVGYDKAARAAEKPQAAETQKEKEIPQQADKAVSEAPAETPAPEESVTLSPKISALARKEQAARQKERELAQRERDLADKLAKAERFDQLQAKLSAKDFSAAEEMGLSYDEYVKYKLDKETAENPEEKRYRSLEEKLASLQKQQEEKAEQDYQTNQALWKKEIARVVESDDFSTIRELGQEDAVLRLINESFEEDDIELSAEDAAKAIEEELVARAEKYTALSKLKKKDSGATKTIGAPKAPKTITQNMTVTSEKVASKPFHLLSESEQIAEAIRRVQEAKLKR